jgi:hypothetical protein
MDDHETSGDDLQTFDLMDTLKLLNGADMEIEQSVADGLIVRAPALGEKRQVSVEPCYPLSRPERFLVFRDSEGNELGLLEDMSDLSDEAREALAVELGKQRFLPVITAVNDIYQEFHIPVWEVETDRGPRQISLRSAHDAHRLPNNRIYVRDAEGNGYLILDLTELDPASQSLLELNV